MAGWLHRTLPTPRRTPVTLAYLVILGLSTLLLHLLDPSTRDGLLAASSTDVAHLASDPLGVMVASALFLPDLHFAPHALELAAVLVPLERRYGAGQAVLVFATGHVLATLATELPVAYAVGHHLLPAAAAHRLDVGVSYGFYAALGAAVLLTTAPRLRSLLLVGAVVAVGVPLALDLDMTTTGHVLALCCGLACAPLLRPRVVPGQATTALRPIRRGAPRPALAG